MKRDLGAQGLECVTPKLRSIKWPNNQMINHQFNHQDQNDGSDRGRDFRPQQAPWPVISRPDSLRLQKGWNLEAIDVARKGTKYDDFYPSDSA